MRDLIGITYDSVSGGPELTAAEWRQTNAAMFVRGTNDLVVGGVRGGAVTNTGFSATIAPLTAVIHPSAALGVYMGAFPAGSAELAKTINAAHATLPRVDAIDVKFYDHEADGSGKRGIDIEYNPGTAASSPSAPTFTGVGWRLGTFAVPASGGGNPAFTPNAALVTYAAAGGSVKAPDVLQRTVGGSQTFTKPTNPPAKWFRVRAWAAGGGGGGVGSAGSGPAEGGGGGGGEYREEIYSDAEMDATVNFTVGSGGAANSAAPGGTGGDTTFPNSVKALTCKGGTGGASMSVGTITQGAAGGDGGTGGSGGMLAAAGEDGGAGRTITGNAIFSGRGGGSPNGGGAVQFVNFVASNGAAGSSPGGGGSGAFGGGGTAFAGGAGAAGKIIIESHYA